MNRLEIRNETRRLLAEKSTSLSYVTDTDLNQFINEAIREACIKAKALERTRSILVTNALATYSIPWEFIEPIVLLNQNGKPLDLIERPMAGSVFLVTGLPIYYFLGQQFITIAARANLTPYVTWPSTCLYGSTYVVPAAPNGYIYECITSGTTAAAPPSYPTVIGDTVTDGTVVWICREYFSMLRTLTLVDTPLSLSGGVGTYSFTYSAMDEGLSTDVDSPNIPIDKHSYLVFYACHKAALKGKDIQLAMGFYTGFAAGFGLPMIGDTGGAQSAT